MRVSVTVTEWIQETLLSGSMPVAIPVAVFAGLLAFFSPCTVPLLPGYLGCITGVAVQELEAARGRRLVVGASLFVLGFTAVYVSAGSVFGYASFHLFEQHQVVAQVLGAVVIVLGLALSGLVPVLNRTVRLPAVSSVGPGVAVMWGGVFGIGWTPCVGPALGSVLVLAAADSTPTASRGAVLAGAFCLGLGVPFIVAALAFARFRLFARGVQRHQRTLTLIGSLMLVAMGVALVAGWWEDLAVALRYWAADRTG